MSEFGGPFRSHTYKVTNFVDLDEAIEQNLAALKQDGYELLSGPIITQSQTGEVWFTNVFKQAKKSDVATKVHVFN